MKHRRRFHREHAGKPCCYCERVMQISASNAGLLPTRDHYVPESAGGREIVVCCGRCNQVKGDMPPDMWKRFMAENPAWWTLEHGGLRRALERGNFWTMGRIPPRTHPDYQGWRDLQLAAGGIIPDPKPEKPSTPMAEPLMALKLARTIGREFDRKFGGES